MADISKIKLPSGTEYDIKDKTSGYITGMTILSYGTSTYAEALAAYQANRVIYCRASSNTNPATGNQLRMAFLAYVNNQTTPTEFEFQYYRSVSSHTSSQQGDQVYVYKLNSSGTWSVTTREVYTKILTGTGLTSSYTTGTSASITLKPKLDSETALSSDLHYVGVDSNGNLCVSIAGGSSGTVTSVGISNDTDGGLSISGSPVTSSGTITIGHSNVLTSAQTTLGIYSTKIDKNGHVSQYGNTLFSVNSESSYGDYWWVLQIPRTGLYSFTNAPGSDGKLRYVSVPSTVSNSYIKLELPTSAGKLALTSDIPTVPTKTSDLTNDSGYITSYTDEKVATTTSIESDVTYYPILGTNTSTASKKYIDSTNLLYWKSGSNIHLSIGSSTNKGSLHLNGSSLYSVTLTTDTITANRTITLPNATGTIALTSDIPTVPSNIVNTITTTAGAHSTLSSATGSVSFNVPTKTSHLTNDSGFVTTDTNTTYTLSNALSSHKFTETLTAGGSGSGTSTATIEFVAGTGITLTDDTTNKKITIASSVTNTDEKLKTTSVTSGTTYYPIVGTNTTNAETKYFDATGLKYAATTGTSSGIGYSVLTLGNNTASGTAGNKIGEIDIYSSSTHCASLIAAPSLASDREIVLPDKNGTIALTSDISGKVDKTFTYTNADNIAGTQYIYNDTYEDDDDNTWERLELRNIGQYTIDNETTDILNNVGVNAFGAYINAVRQTGTGYNSGWLNVGDNVSLGVEDSDGNSYRSVSLGIAWSGVYGYYVYAHSPYLQIGDGTYKYIIDCSSPTANRTLILPDESGTIALTSDIPTDRTKVQIVRW